MAFCILNPGQDVKFCRRLIIFDVLNRYLLKMARVYVGNLDPRVSERDIVDEFRFFGVIKR
jgi:hypothetical protein